YIITNLNINYFNSLTMTRIVIVINLDSKHRTKIKLIQLKKTIISTCLKALGSYCYFLQKNTYLQWYINKMNLSMIYSQNNIKHHLCGRSKTREIEKNDLQQLISAIRALLPKITKTHINLHSFFCIICCIPKVNLMVFKPMNFALSNHLIVIGNHIIRKFLFNLNSTSIKIVNICSLVVECVYAEIKIMIFFFFLKEPVNVTCIIIIIFYFAEYGVIVRPLFGSHTSGPECSSITFFTFSKMSSNESPFTIASREDALINMVIGYRSAACKRLIALELTSRMQSTSWTEARDVPYKLSLN
ncbi:hypothetical protein AGLY_005311, partial [Aphis glycines]